MLWIIMFVCAFGTLFNIVSIIGEIIDAEWRDALKAFIRVCVFSAICFISLFALAAIAVWSYQETEQTASYELVSLQDNSQISGHSSGNLFYVYASIDTEEVYSYYYKFNDGFKKGKITSENVIIYEKDNCNPLIIEYTTYTKGYMNGFLRAILSFGYPNTSEKHYEIYVPKGTILQIFNLDLQ